MASVTVRAWVIWYCTCSFCTATTLECRNIYGTVLMHSIHGGARVAGDAGIIDILLQPMMMMLNSISMSSVLLCLYDLIK